MDRSDVKKLLCKSATINNENIREIYWTLHKREPSKEEINAYNIGFVMALRNVAKVK